MDAPDHDPRLAEPPQRPRFGPLRSSPPEQVLEGLSGAASDTGWVVERFGHDSGFPNGGIWTVTADRAGGSGPRSAWVKRTGAGYLGTSDVWRCQVAPEDPQWWGREAAFYDSDLATSGWGAGVRAARCYAIDDHDECRDLWLESVDVPADLPVCERAVRGLAHWQVAHIDTKHSWLSDDWIPTHVRRRGLDNERTLAHPAWPIAIERGLDPALRDLVAARVTDPIRIRHQLRDLPRVLTHYDFHQSNIGTVGEEVVIIDWAYVGWGPVGHDVGHLALDSVGPGTSPSEIWRALRSAYCDALTAAGWNGDLDVVRRSMVTSNVLRLGWTIDHVLSVVDQVPDDVFAAMAARLNFFADLH
ncbi:phosphotransferase [Actinopolymorpha pittospori]|uniref:Aminoglycoside phosphotransferase domain-containing protein n=1 Tax=Actinopolymorpha pittospori TaxID=648752 RepID=A0A927RNL6_9ACTN|nr:phosphotransferase [Actinopolymorpha pittospori]MBE1610203.1 hypothetical protein [Actinopolymorpha pittospori]